MERAAASGLLAASVILNGYDVRPEPLWSVAPRGVLEFLPVWERRKPRPDGGD
jgi:hypothetical protein